MPLLRGSICLVFAGVAMMPAVAIAQAPTAEDCGVCHDEAAEFLRGPHGRAMARVDPEIASSSCVACHDPSDEHLEDPMPENVVRRPGDASCTTCHAARDGQLWSAGPGHRRHGVACLDCHASGHQDLGFEHLLADDPFATCAACHAVQAGAFHRPFAHRDGREPFACTECHSTHGLERVGRLALLGKSEACTDCHTELAGPFVFPHPPREVDGCLSCHESHGSTNPRLLNRRQVLNNCLECHANVPAFHDIAQARFRACSSCHVAIHGSNRDPKLFDD